MTATTNATRRSLTPSSIPTPDDGHGHRRSAMIRGPALAPSRSWLFYCSCSPVLTQKRLDHAQPPINEHQTERHGATGLRDTQVEGGPQGRADFDGLRSERRFSDRSPRTTHSSSRSMSRMTYPAFIAYDQPPRALNRAKTFSIRSGTVVLASPHVRAIS